MLPKPIYIYPTLVLLKVGKPIYIYTKHASLKVGWGGSSKLLVPLSYLGMGLTRFFVAVPSPSIQGLGSSPGFSYQLVDLYIASHNKESTDKIMFILCF